jgi:hypothetical protein
MAKQPTCTAGYRCLLGGIAPISTHKCPQCQCHIHTICGAKTAVVPGVRLTSDATATATPTPTPAQATTRTAARTVTTTAEQRSNMIGAAATEKMTVMTTEALLLLLLLLHNKALRLRHNKMLLPCNETLLQCNHNDYCKNQGPKLFQPSTLKILQIGNWQLWQQMPIWTWKCVKS